MKSKKLIIVCSTLAVLTISCTNNAQNAPSKTKPTSVENKSNSSSQSNTQSTESSDNRISNATKAKMPKGNMTFTLDGKSISLPTHTVQCMYVGMNSTLAQSVISGGNASSPQFSIVHMSLPKVGKLNTKEKIGAMPMIGMQLIQDGVVYNNMKDNNIEISITKITQDGNNYYVSGSFNGILHSQDGKAITLKDGIFESAYL